MYQLKAMLLTFAFEVPIIALAMYPRARGLKLLLLCFAPTLITHPILWWALTVRPISLSYSSVVLAGEIMVMASESLIIFYLARCSWQYALFVAIGANMLSWLVGEQVFVWFLH